MKNKISKKNSWQTKKLGEVSNLVKGKKPKSFSSTGKKYLTAKVIRHTQEPQYTQDENVIHISKEDVVIIMDGSNSGEMFRGLEGVLASTMGVLDFNRNNFESRFLLYFLVGHREEFTRSRTGSAIPHLNKEQFNSLLVPMVSINEQKRIVKVLDKAFEKIEIAKENAEKNLENVKEIFENYSEKTYKKLLTEKELENLGELAKLVRGPFGGSLTKSMFVDDGYAVYEQRNAIGKNVTDFRYFINQKKFNEMERFSVSKGDILMSCSGTIGEFVVIKKEPIKGVINQALLKITPNKVKVEIDYLLFVLSIFIQNSDKHKKGTAIKNIAAVKELKKIPIPLLSLKEQKQIVAKLDKLNGEVEKYEAILRSKIASLEELKKSVLNKAFNGEL